MVFEKFWCFVFVLMMAACSKQSMKEKPFTMPQANAVVASSLLQHLQYLSSDHLQGRKVGSRGGELTQKYLIEQLSKEHVLPFGEHYLSPFIIDRMLSR